MFNVKWKKKKRENPPSLLLFGCLIVCQTHGTARHGTAPPPPHPAPEELIYLPGVFVLRLLITTVGVYFDTLSVATTGPSTASSNWRARQEEKRLNGKEKKKKEEERCCHCHPPRSVLFSPACLCLFRFGKMSADIFGQIHYVVSKK